MGPFSQHFHLLSSILWDANEPPPQTHCLKGVGDIHVHVDHSGVAKLHWDGLVICKERS